MAIFINPPTARLALGSQGEQRPEKYGDEDYRNGVITLAMRNASGVSANTFQEVIKGGRSLTGGSEEERHTASILIPILDKISGENGILYPMKVHYAYLPAAFHAIQIDQKTGEPMNTDPQSSYERIVRYFYDLPVTFYGATAPGIVDMLLEYTGIPTDVAPQQPLSREQSIRNAHEFSRNAALVWQEILRGLFLNIYKGAGSKVLMQDGRRRLDMDDATKLISPLLGINVVSPEKFRTHNPLEAQAFPLEQGETAQALIGEMEEAARKLRKQTDPEWRYTRLIKKYRADAIARLSKILDEKSVTDFNTIWRYASESPIVSERIRNINGEEVKAVLEQMRYALEHYLPKEE